MAKKQAELVLGREHLIGDEASGEVPVEDLLNTLMDDLASDPEYADDADEGEEQASPDEPVAEDDESEAEESEESESEDDEPGEEEDPEESEDDEPESGEETEEEEKPKEGDEEEPAYHTITIDGDEYEATLDELKAGYSRTEVFTRKTQALADEKRTHADEHREQVGQYEARLDVLERAIKQAAPNMERTPEEWQALKDADNGKFLEEFASAQLAAQKLQVVTAEQGRVAAEQEEELKGRLTEHLDAERDLLLTRIPEWSDEELQKTEKQELMGYAAETFGYTEEDLGQVMDHRLMVILRNSMLYEKGQGEGRKLIHKKAKAAPRLRPAGKKKSPAGKTSKAKALRKAGRKLAQTGSDGDAAALIEMMLDDED